MNPAAEVGRVANRHGLIYMLDACQSVGQMPVDVQEIGCHILSGTGRKFLRGPRGTGFLFVSDTILDRIEPPFIDLQAATWIAPDRYELAQGAKRFDNFECHVAGRIGLARAVANADQIGLHAIGDRITALGAALRDRLSAENAVTVHDRGERHCGIVTFRIDGEDPTRTAERLSAQGINVSVSIRPYAQLDLGERGLESLVRASVHYYNTEDEIDRFVKNSCSG